MALSRPRATSLALLLAPILALAALGLYRLSFSALGVVTDPRPPAMALAGVSLVLASMVLLRRQGLPWSRPSKVLAALALLLALLALGLLVEDRYFSYRSEEVSFDHGEIRLRGTLVLPRGPGPHPALVLTHGAGEETRDENLFYARLFARRGIAGLAYDKRGSGESGGASPRAPYRDLAGDAVAAFRMLAGRPDVDARRIGYWGLSEGGWVAPLAAVASDAAVVIVLSASGESPALQVEDEVAALVAEAGFGEAAARRARELYSRLSELQRSGEGREALDEDLQKARSEPWFGTARYLPAALPPYEEILKLPWFPTWRRNMDFDPAPVWEQVSCPVLVILGGRDPKVGAREAAEQIARALARGGNGDVTIKIYPEAGHGVVEWWLPGHLPPPRFPGGYPESMVEWARERLR